MEPVKKFKDRAQAEEYLAYWQNKLFLSDWIISIELSLSEEMDEPDNAGDADIDYVGKNAKICLNNELKYDGVTKQYHEQILVHELFHLKFYSGEILKPEDKTIEAAIYNLTEHQLIDELSKAALMIRYDIDYMWFKN